MKVLEVKIYYVGYDLSRKGKNTYEFYGACQILIENLNICRLWFHCQLCG